MGIPALILLTVGFVGHAFEMRRIRIAKHQNEMGSVNIFADRRNFKWYGLIIAGVAMWYVAEHA